MKKILVITLLLFCLTACNSTSWWNRNSSDIVTVGRGDTLYSISRNHNVNLKDLINTNHLKAPYTLKIGQKLKLPAPHYHIVKKGESLYGISKMYNTDVLTLGKVNNLQTPYSLSIGQKLVLPGNVSSIIVQKENAKIYVAKNNRYSKINKKQDGSKKTKVASSRSNKFDWPIRGTIISGYGNLGKGRKNDGINIKAPKGTNVKAADSGVVAYAGNELKGFGNLILLKHKDGWITAYAHNDRLFVKKGQNISRGEKIATVGSTGSVTTPQLHFEVRAGKKAVNPRTYLP